MATDVWHDLGPVPGGCTVCDSDGALTMGEARVRRSLVERLRREHVARPARLVTCHGCGWRWTVRSTDTPPSAMAAVVSRTTVEPAPEQPLPEVPDVRGRHELVTARTVLPVPRERRTLSARLR